MSYLHVDSTTFQIQSQITARCYSLFLSICTHIPANENLFPQIFLLNLNALFYYRTVYLQSNCFPALNVSAQNFRQLHPIPISSYPGKLNRWVNNY